MAGQLRIVTQNIHRADTTFVVRVAITGARPNRPVRIRLWQSAGVKPFYIGAAPADIDANGEGLAEFFDVVVHGSDSVAVLVADGHESDVPLRYDEIHIEVVP
jgi:hypothetical protein